MLRQRPDFDGLYTYLDTTEGETKDWAEWFRSGPRLPDDFDTGVDPLPEERDPH